MKIRKVAVGNAAEAFIEGNFTNGVNIISSDDNNKGKCIQWSWGALRSVR